MTRRTSKKVGRILLFCQAASHQLARQVLDDDRSRRPPRCQIRAVCFHSIVSSWVVLIPSIIHPLSIVAFGPGRDRDRKLILNDLTEKFGVLPTDTFDSVKQCCAELQVMIQLRVCVCLASNINFFWSDLIYLCIIDM